MNAQAAPEVKEFKPADYKSELKSIWCPGCGDFGVVSGMYRAFSNLQIPPEKIAVISGIGCSSRLPGYVNAYGFNTIHGRALPIATGLKQARPDLTVVLGSGDGDAFSIGAGHLPHAARRNIDMTLVIMDNNTYGLTKGQMSPTTPLENKTKSTLYGSIDSPVKPIPMLLTMGCSFVARAFSGDINHLTEMIQKGIEHPGFSVVQVWSPCPTFRGDSEYGRIKSVAKKIPENHDSTNLEAALKLAMEPGETYLGLFYQNKKQSSYGALIENQRKVATQKGVQEIKDLINTFK